MKNGEWIAYLIKKEFGKFDLVDFLESYNISEKDFEKFLEAGAKAVDEVAE